MTQSAAIAGMPAVRAQTSTTAQSARGGRIRSSNQRGPAGRRVQEARDRQEWLLDGGGYQLMPDHRHGRRNGNRGRQRQALGEKRDGADVVSSSGAVWSRVMSMVAMLAVRIVDVRERMQRRVRRHRPERQHQRDAASRQQAAEGVNCAGCRNVAEHESGKRARLWQRRQEGGGERSTLNAQLLTLNYREPISSIAGAGSAGRIRTKSAT